MLLHRYVVFLCFVCDEGEKKEELRSPFERERKENVLGIHFPNIVARMSAQGGDLLYGFPSST